jgi:P27 family predicted phage terminase small subunit
MRFGEPNASHFSDRCNMAKPGPKERTVKTIPLRQSWDPPSHLSREARAEFRRVVCLLRERGTLDLVDAELVARRAELVEIATDAYAAIQEEGLTVTSDRGNVAPHPAVAIQVAASGQLRLIDRELGLTAPRPRSGQATQASGYGGWSSYMTGTGESS